MAMSVYRPYFTDRTTTHALAAPSGVSNSFHRSLLSILASLLSLKTTKPTGVSARTSMAADLFEYHDGIKSLYVDVAAQ